MSAPRVITLKLKLDETTLANLRQISERTQARHRLVLHRGWPYDPALTAALWREEVRLWAHDEWPKSGVRIRGRKFDRANLLNACMGVASMATGTGSLHPDGDGWTSWWSTEQLAKAMLMTRKDAVVVLEWLVRCHRLSRTPGKVIAGRREPDKWRLILPIKSDPFGSSPNTNVTQGPLGQKRRPIESKPGSDWVKSGKRLRHVEINNHPNSVFSVSSVKDAADDGVESQQAYLERRRREAVVAEQEAKRRR